LKDLIAEKQKGHKIEKVAEVEDTNVIDLMAALRASLDGKTGGGAKKTPAKKAPAKAKARKAG